MHKYARVCITVVNIYKQLCTYTTCICTYLQPILLNDICLFGSFGPGVFVACTWLNEVRAYFLNCLIFYFINEMFYQIIESYASFL